MISKKQKTSPININQKIDYKDIDLLTLFVTEQGKILPRRATGVSLQQQRKLAKAIKRARVLSLFPFVASKNFQFQSKLIYKENFMGNFIDKTFTVIADILLKVLPASKQEKQAFSYYRAGMSAQSKGRYAEALQNYYEALQVEEDPYDRSYTLYNIGLIYGNTGKYSQALEFYHQALSLNSNLPQALNNIAVIYHSQALRAQSLEEDEYIELSKELFDKSAEYWVQALKLAPDNYPGARNWLKVTGRLNDNN